MKMSSRVSVVMAAFTLISLGCGEPWIFNLPTYSVSCEGGQDDHNRCRDERDGPWPRAWQVILSDSTLLPASAACLDSHTDEVGENPPIDPLRLAEQACNRHNATLKKDLVECVDKGLLFKTNATISGACPAGREADVHELGENAACELENPVVKKDVGNGWFAYCEGAIGPGPAGIPNESWEPWNEKGCCEVIRIQHEGTGDVKSRGYEFSGDQRMGYRPWLASEEDWSEPFFAETEHLEIYMCNPPSLGPEEERIHFYCAETSQDIMVEGWQNGVENPDHQGFGWCNVTTGDYKRPGQDTNPIDKIFGDLTVAEEQMGKPKGVAALGPGQTPTDHHTCQQRIDAFGEHCSDAEIISTHQFAHSMGGIVSAVWGIPIDFFGGSVVGLPGTCGPGEDCSIRNNCDPVPAIVRLMHPYAIYHWGMMSHSDEQGARRRNYRFCNDFDILDNCVKPGGYEGVPQGPDRCGTNDGPPCVYQPWCDWKPYQEPIDLDSGREDYLPSQCEGDVLDLVAQVKTCLDAEGVQIGLECVRAAYDLYQLTSGIGQALEDHAFDDQNDWGGYRVHTLTNWDVPRREKVHGSIVVSASGPGGTGECDGPTREGPLGLECLDIP